MSASTLFICEKPSQAADIAKHIGATTRGKNAFTGNGIVVTWCIGHLVEQSPPQYYAPELKFWDMNYLPVIPSQWHMQVKETTKQQFVAVKALLQGAAKVVVATDADREGEVIAREVMQLCGYRGLVQRLWLGALDSASIKKALAKLKDGKETYPLYLSGMGRARADWLAGMNITMALTKAFGSGGRGGVLHFGRVQTPVLSLIVRRERAILNFKPKTHFLLDAAFQIKGSLVPMNWKMPDRLKDAQGHCIDKAAVEAVASKVRNQAGRVVDVKTTPERELAPLLFSLGSIQKEASAKFGFKAAQVLDACQKLYETHKATTYPRTDCEYLPQSMFSEVPEVLKALAQIDPGFGKQLAAAKLDKPSRVFNDKKITAHHAIIPTGNSNVSLTAMSSVERTIYDLIRRRYVAQFLGDFEYLKTVIEVSCAAELFTQTGKLPIKQGWRQLYMGLDSNQGADKATGSKGGSHGCDVSDASAKDVMLPDCAVGDQALNIKADLKVTKTEPPKRYTEGTLISAMESIDKEIDDPRMKAIMRKKEKAGIGTDATRAAIIEGLFKREYIANDKKLIYPLPRGVSLIELLERISPDLADPVLTAIWEEQLMAIEDGTNTLEQFEQGMSSWLNPLIAKIKAQAGQYRIDPSVAASGASKPAAKPTAPSSVPSRPPYGMLKRAPQQAALTSPLVSPLTSSVGAPSTARAAVNAAAKAPPAASAVQSAQLSCPNCGKPMKLRTGPRGQFYGCTGFPLCKKTMSA